MNEKDFLIDYKSLEGVTQSQLLHEPFWMLASNRISHEIEGRSVIVLKDKVDEYITNLANTLPEKGKKWPFYLQHQDLFKGAQLIFKELFGESADTLILSYYREDHSESAFFFTSSRLLNMAHQNEIHKFPIGPDYPNNRVLKFQKKIDELGRFPEIREEVRDLGLNFRLAAGLFPIIGSYNDVTGSVNPNYNLILGSFPDDRFSTGAFNPYLIIEENEDEINSIKNEVKNEKKNWISHCDDDIFRKYFFGGFPAYCIKRFNLHDSRLLDKFNPYNMIDFMVSAEKRTVEEFKSTLFYFTLGNIIGKSLKITDYDFEAVMPHFYKLDRTATSVDKHKELKGSLRKKYKVAREYAGWKADLTISDFIQFFLQNAKISPDELRHSPDTALDKALTERRAIKNLFGDNEILSRFLGPSGSNRFNEFLHGQKKAHKDILPVLEEK